MQAGSTQGVRGIHDVGKQEMTAMDTQTTTTEDTLVIERGSVPPLTVTPRMATRYARYGKPTVDRIGAAFVVLLASPLVVIVSAAVLVGLGRPILYRQPRIGRNGETFGMLKFRTMEPDRRSQTQPIPAASDRRRRHKTADDPRHTRLGRLLRRLSLDELPQLWNVLRGDMSLVGPRPELPSVVERYEDWQHLRHAVKPGITGLWQVTERQRSDGDMHLHTAVDLTYLGRLSLLTDLRILLKTPTALTKGR